MTGLFVILLTLTCALLTWRLVRVRIMLKDLGDAVSSNAPYLSEQSSHNILNNHIHRLAIEYQRLLNQNQRLTALETAQQNQIDAVLSQIQEAVFSIDHNNIIVHTNTAACNTFNNGTPIKGHRYEAFIRNPDFIDCAHLAKNGHPQIKREISVLIRNKQFWFEVSGTPIPKGKIEPYGSVLFVFHDITRLKELEIVKNNFVANVSHELKTPITIIKGFTETLIDDNETLPSETRLRFLKKIEFNSERLHLTVMDLLTLSKIESDAHFIQKNPTKMGPLLDTIADNHLALKKPGQSLILENHLPEKTVLNIDEFRIGQAFQSLIENAIRYSGESSKISISARLDEENKTLTCCVNDNGPGIPSADLRNIFRRFYRVDKGRGRTNGGTGLGLSIARGIVELHNGKIMARNLESGGLSVQFEIPVETESASN